MPSVDYKCVVCLLVFEKKKRLGETLGIVFCPSCNSVSRRIFTPTPFVMKS